MRKCRTAVAIICNTLYNTTCIVHVCGYVYKNTICYSTELNKKEPNCTVLLQRLLQFMPVVEMGNMFEDLSYL